MFWLLEECHRLTFHRRFHTWRTKGSCTTGQITTPDCWPHPELWLWWPEHWFHATCAAKEGPKNSAVMLLTQEKGKELKHSQWARYQMLRRVSFLWVGDKEQHSQHPQTHFLQTGAHYLEGGKKTGPSRPSLDNCTSECVFVCARACVRA